MSSPARERTRRRLAFAALYLCEGAPIGFLWWALPTILRERGAPLERIGALSAGLVLPWALKFLWAPLLDTRRRLRAWIAGAQVVMALTLLPLLVLDPRQGLGPLMAWLLAHAVAAASQDAAIDALAIRTTPPEERGRLNGWMQVGMLFGRSLFGGGALLLRRWTGDQGPVLLLVGLLLVAALGLALRGQALAAAEEPLERPRLPRERLAPHLAEALRRPTTWLGLLFAATAGAGFESVGVLAGPLLVDRGLDSARVGTFFGLPAVGAMALGALLGGRLADRRGPRLATWLGGLLVAGLVLALAGLVRTPAEPERLLVLLAALYLGIGLFTAASYALFMDLTDPALGATQFSAFMGATNLCESWSARAGGALAGTHGYASAFALPGLVGLAALALLPRLRPRGALGRASHRASP